MVVNHPPTSTTHNRQWLLRRRCCQQSAPRFYLAIISWLILSWNYKCVFPKSEHIHGTFHSSSDNQLIQCQAICWKVNILHLVTWSFISVCFWKFRIFVNEINLMWSCKFLILWNQGVLHMCSCWVFRQDWIQPQICHSYCRRPAKLGLSLGCRISVRWDKRRHGYCVSDKTSGLFVLCWRWQIESTDFNFQLAGLGSRDAISIGTVSSGVKKVQWKSQFLSQFHFTTNEKNVLLVPLVVPNIHGFCIKKF